MSNPATTLYHAWLGILRLRSESLEPGTAQQLGRDRGTFVADRDGAGRPILGFGYVRWRFVRSTRPYMGDFNLWADGSFRINFYDNDLKLICANTFLGWDWGVDRRVVFYSGVHAHHAWIDPHDFRDPIPYFRWGAIPRTARLHLVPDEGSWRIAVHPDSPEHARACHRLDAEYDLAARRYERARRREERDQGLIRPKERVIEDNAHKVEAITMLLDPYEPARRPKEEAHERNNLAARP